MDSDSNVGRSNGGGDYIVVLMGTTVWRVMTVHGIVMLVKFVKNSQGIWT